MSTFEVKIREITQLDAHPNADKLELVVIGGYKAVVQKGIHAVGDSILYVPEDTVFTDISIAEKLNIAGYLTGKQKNRVKSIRLRGILSQGIVLPIRVIQKTLRDLQDEHFNSFVLSLNPNAEPHDFYPDSVFTVGSDWAEFLKLEKYEEPIPIEMAGQVRRWPSFLQKYDIENIKRPESFAAMVPGEEVVATEKLHGTNITIAIGPGLEEGERAFVCSRNNALKESDTNVYWRAVKEFGLIDALVRLGDGCESIALHGEVIGVQDLKYGHDGGRIGFRAFDITVNGKFVGYDLFKHMCDIEEIPTVPELYRGPYDYDTLTQLAEGKTECDGDHIREGLVVKPVAERVDQMAGRCNFKFIAESYLLRSNKDATELH